MRDKADLVYIYKKNRKVGVIQKDLIMYVNCHGRNIHIGTPIIEVEHNGTLKDAKEKLGDEQFVQVNKSDLVNLKFVFYTDFSSVTMRDGMVFPVTPAYSSNFNSRMLNYYVNREHL